MATRLTVLLLTLMLFIGLWNSDQQSVSYANFPSPPPVTCDKAAEVAGDASWHGIGTQGRGVSPSDYRREQASPMRPVAPLD